MCALCGVGSLKWGIGAACGATVIAVVISVASFGGFDQTTQNLIVGRSAAVLGIIAFSTPLQDLVGMIRNRTAESLSAPLLFCQLACGVCWVIYGLILPDINLVIPNAGVLLLGLVQLVVWLSFCGNDRRRRQATEAERVAAASAQAGPGGGSDAVSSVTTALTSAAEQGLATAESATPAFPVGTTKLGVSGVASPQPGPTRDSAPRLRVASSVALAVTSA